MASNQSNAGEQGASFENGAPRCDATRRKAKFKSQIKHVVGPFETYICADAWSKAHGCGEDDAAEPFACVHAAVGVRGGVERHDVVHD